MNETKQIPPLAGICSYEEAARIGYSVEESVEFLKRYNYVKTRLVQIMSHQMNSIPEWEVKGAFSFHMYLDAEHSTLIRKRVSEMREPPLHLDKVPDNRLQLAMDEVLHSENTVELLRGIIGVVRVSLLKALKKHLNETNPLVDQPTCRILKIIIQEEQSMIDWGIAALEALMLEPEMALKAESRAVELEIFLQNAGGIRGDEGRAEIQIPSRRSDKPFQLILVPQRDSRFKDIWNNVDPADTIYKDKSKEPKERIWALLFKRIREMDVPEMMCSIIAQTEGKPWAYYHDMCRQVWDECRHSMMGEVAFVDKGIDWTKLPIRINWSFELNTLLTPIERHAILYDIEFGLMPGDTGKKFEWEIAKESAYLLAATFHDHDWADEVLHAQIGRKWFVSELGNPKDALELAQKAYQKLELVRPDYTIENPHWWEEFYKGNF